MGGIDPFGDIMGTSAGPGREERIYLYRAGSHLHSSVSSTHAGGRKRSHTQGCWDTWFEEPVSFPANQTAGLQLMSAFNCIIISAASHAQEEGVEEEKTSARESRPRNLIELAD